MTLRVGDSECVRGSLKHTGLCASYGGMGHRELDRRSVVGIRPTTEPRCQIYVEQILRMTFKAGIARKKGIADVANKRKKGDVGRRKNSPRFLNTACIDATTP